MKKTTRTARKVLSVFLSVLMILTTLTVAVPGLVLAADGNKYYVKVYVNIYDGSDGYGGAYTVNESTGKPDNYSWATNDGWYGRINMTGFTVFGEEGDYDAQDVSEALLEAEKLNTYYDMSGLSSDNANGDWDSKAIAKETYTFTLDSFPVEIFWMNDENNWDGGNTGFAIRKLTVATSEGGVEHTMWEGLAGSDSETYNYYGSITPTGIHTCFEDYAKNYDMDDYKFYKAITTSSQRAWADPYSAGSYGTYYLNEYANGGVSATFSEGVESIAYNVDYINTGSTDTYFMNFINHSKTQAATITGINNSDKFVTNPAGTVIPAGGIAHFELKNISSLGGDGAIANFCFNYTLENVYASDALDASLAQFYQPCYIGVWNSSDDSKSADTFQLDNFGNFYITFQTNEGILVTNSTSGSNTAAASFNYTYYVDTAGMDSWEDTGLRFHMTETNYRRINFQNPDYSPGTLKLGGSIDNSDSATLRMADFVFSSLNGKAYTYSVSATGVHGLAVSPTWPDTSSDSKATLYNNNEAWCRFGGVIFEGSSTSTNPGTIEFTNMKFRDSGGYTATFSGTINVYTFDKTELRKYIRETLLDFAPMEDRYASDAFNTYQSALEVAMRTLANQKTNQYDVNQAYNNLKSAVEALQTNANLVNQIDELTHIQYVGGIGSEIAAQTAERYVLVPLGEHTVPQKDEYIGNGTYKDATNKKSNLTTNYTVEDTEIDYLNYYYWNIDYSQIDPTIALLNNALTNFDSDTFSSTFKAALVNAKDNLAAIDQTTTGDNNPTSQEDVDNVVNAAKDLLAHIEEGYEHCDYDANNDGENELKTKDSTCSEAGYTYYKCNICGKVQKVADLPLAEHTNEDADHNCDVCGTKLSDCTDNNNDHNCDVCGTELSQCADNNNDHNCDVCGAELSQCADNNNDHNCDVCGAELSDCADNNNDHNCDVCGAELSQCADNNNDHNCDVCGAELSQCADNNNDHNCDVCGTELSQCADGDNDHDCDVCGAELSQCADGDNDHNCDVCGDKLSDCADNNNDHDCDVCGDKLSDCTWGDPVLTTKPTADAKGEYTETCGTCGTTQITKVDLADYSEFNTVVKALENLANTENLTAEAAKAIADALAEAEKLDKNLPADATTAGGKLIEGGQDEIDNLVEQLKNVVADTNAAIADGSALEPDYTEWDKAETAYDALTEEELANVKDEIITEAEALKAEIAEKQADDTLTQATATQKDIDDATARLNEIVAGITDGSLCDPDYSKVEEKLEDANEAENLNKDTQDKIDDIKDALEEIKGKTEPEANAKDDQPAVDALEKQLDEILEDIADGKATAPDYTEWDEAETAYDELTNEQLENVKGEILEEVTNLKNTINALKDDDTANVADDQKTIDDAADRLNEIIAGINDGSLKDPDYSDAEAAIENAENIENLTDEEKQTIAEAKDELQNIKDMKDPEATMAENQDDVDAIKDKVQSIINKYADCENGNHNWGAPELTKKPTADEQGEYTETCGTCGTTQITKVDLADYDEFNTVVEALENLANTENLTTEAAKAIADALAEAEKLDKNLPADATTAGGKLIEGGQDEIDNLVEQLKNVVTDTNAAIADGSALEPDYEAWKEAKNAYDALDKTNVKTEIITEAEALKAEIAGKQADDTLTQATATQVRINEATARLNEIIAGINDGSLVKPDYSDAEGAIQDAKDVADSENIPNDVEADIEAEIAELENQLEEIKKSDPASNDEEANNKIAEIEEAAKEIVETYGECAKGNHTDVETDGNHNCDVCGKLDVTSHNYADPQLTRPVYDEEKGEWSDGYYTSTCNCGDTSETTIARADYEDYDKAVADLNALLADATLTDAAKTEINKVLADNTILQDYIATTEEQKIVDDAAAALNVVLDKLTDDEGKLEDEYKKPDYEAWDAAEGTYDALDKTNAPVDLVTEANGLKNTINALKDDDTANAADDQGAINNATARLNEIIVEINKVLTEKPDFDGYDASHDTYEELVEQYGDKIKDSVANDVAALDAIVDGVRTNETATKAEDQVTVDNAKTALDAIIDGITDGSLIKPADFTEVNKDLAEAKDKAEDNEVLDSVKVDIKEIEDRLDELKKDPATNANDQEGIDALEKELEDIIAGIDDGSLVKPYYTDTEYAIKDAEKDIDNGGHLSADDKQALNELKKDLNEIKNDPTSNYKDNQDDVDAIKDAVDEIIAKYSECAKGNHTCTEEVVAPDCENEGYTKYTCTVCGKVYTGNYTDNLGHNEVIIPAVEATCSSEGYTEGKKCTVCGKITVEPQIVSKLPHTDADEDGVCDVCGQTDLYAGCGCLCHNNNWFWHIVYLIIRIIWKVFKIHPVCACGRLHY